MDEGHLQRGAAGKAQVRRLATREETDASILRKLAVLNRRLGGQG